MRRESPTSVFIATSEKHPKKIVAIPRGGPDTLLSTSLDLSRELPLNMFRFVTSTDAKSPTA
jgi:hypothetical protein